MADDQKPRWRVPPGQRITARALRRNQTEAEQKLWLELRATRLAGLRFRRQHPVGPYVVDFVCLPARLVIELDGGQHYTPEGEARDIRRDRFIAGEGLTVLRFSNLDVLNNMSGVLETILAAARPARPPPHPSPASGRGSDGQTSGKSPLPLAGEGWEGEPRTNGKSPLPLAGEGWEGAPRPGAEQADQDKDQGR